ncbi:unnamed protein product [Adineta ricciae]|uniref:Uncharacterized protein n=1 Tax=Adineta ricciae TaxID=249248 RepID=A0A814E5S4_ADIRI|nr:unnamed protein product [Adineta ricciae]CAF1183435.1 unnamed protein product [Adineta ricciae]
MSGTAFDVQTADDTAARFYMESVLQNPNGIGLAIGQPTPEVQKRKERLVLFRIQHYSAVSDYLRSNTMFDPYVTDTAAVDLYVNSPNTSPGTIGLVYTIDKYSVAA